jgi:hypothetical protein
MTFTAASHKSPHLYVECDLSDGQTLVEWRRDRHGRRPRASFLRRLAGTAS